MMNDSMVVAGVMSGTSADGIDVALVAVSESKPRGRKRPRHMSNVRLLGHAEFPYPSKVRAAVLAAMNATQARVADLARLNFLLGELYADAVLATQRRLRTKVDLVGCHGQTLYHQGAAQIFLGRKVAATWQTGEAAVIAARVGVPVVSDFRPADMAAGGKGAPLVPYLDYLWFRDARVGRVAQNIGGIANLTAIPAGAGPEQVTAFDTGPGNMVIDAVTHELFGRAFDRDGRIAASGEVSEPVLARMLRGSFFRERPPKTAGREEFGREFVAEFLRACGRARKQDVVATATALTARSIADAVKRFVVGKSPTSRTVREKWGTQARNSFREMILSGGGARNATLVAMLAEQLAPLGIVLRFSDEFGLPSEAKEAVAFAVLAYETWNRRASNLPSATGARKPAVLGKISYA
ncbi:MAG TPA: anhydro-N-acetylmuramic acid kinase [Candidatus Dormibacteraeota bacterium]|nr:anhydro-N-acetylmuramic acid kinase [Candidatus Dormibacteraeota bacterium]